MENGKVTQQDYLRYGRIWQRVAPELDPYPEVRAGLSAMAEEPRCEMAAQMPDTGETGELIELVQAIRRSYLLLARCAPHALGRRVLRQLAEEKAGQLRRLMSVYYVLTGECYHCAVPAGGEENLPWCQALRRRYLEETALAGQYQRAAQQLADGCLQRVLLRLGEETCRSAGQLLHLLEGNLLA